MKIIKRGTKTPPDKRIYVGKCRLCGCKFTYMEKNITWISTDIDAVACPQCGYYVPIPLIKRKYKGDDK